MGVTTNHRSPSRRASFSSVRTKTKTKTKTKSLHGQCSVATLQPNQPTSWKKKKKMKRKKWTEEEEQTLITKYSELQSSKTLAKLKTREKKYQPVADHVNTMHHLQGPITFPFRWSWRDVSIKVQNMRHQYLGVKQKIRASDGEFNWMDGQDHWPNFLKYKEVFGDVDLEVVKKGGGGVSGGGGFEEDGVCGFGEFSDGVLGLGLKSEEFDGVEENWGRLKGEEGNGVMRFENLEIGNVVERRFKRLKRDRGIGFIGSQILELREVVGKREEKRREMEFRREEEELSREERNWEREEKSWEREESSEGVRFEWEERQRMWERRELEQQREFEDDRRRWLMKMQEKREEEEMAWRESMVALQIEHEKQMMQMHADTCQNQMQVLGALVRVIYQFFGSGNDGLGGGIGGLAPQVLQNLQHPDGLVDDNGKPDVNSSSHFM